MKTINTKNMNKKEILSLLNKIGKEHFDKTPNKTLCLNPINKNIIEVSSE